MEPYKVVRYGEDSPRDDGDLRQDTIYLWGRRGDGGFYSALVPCPCGECGHFDILLNAVRLKDDEPGGPMWTLTENADGTISLFPSINVSQYCPARHHYYITNSLFCDRRSSVRGA